MRVIELSFHGFCSIQYYLYVNVVIYSLLEVCNTTKKKKKKKRKAYCTAKETLFPWPLSVHAILRSIASFGCAHKLTNTHKKYVKMSDFVRFYLNTVSHVLSEDKQIWN